MGVASFGGGWDAGFRAELWVLAPTWLPVLGEVSFPACSWLRYPYLNNCDDGGLYLEVVTSPWFQAVLTQHYAHSLFTLY